MTKPGLTNKELLKDLLKTQLYGLERRLRKAQNKLVEVMDETIKGIQEARRAQEEVERRFKE
ncbi:MAG: hypothetical protein Q7S42_01330 [Candidatus Omnitrophota bacterium]|nr:hypothetical protein [Candidatus Omnitrophota bacterium]